MGTAPVPRPPPPPPSSPSQSLKGDLFSKTALIRRDLFHRLEQSVLIYLPHAVDPDNKAARPGSEPINSSRAGSCMSSLQYFTRGVKPAQPQSILQLTDQSLCLGSPMGLSVFTFPRRIFSTPPSRCQPPGRIPQQPHLPEPGPPQTRRAGGCSPKFPLQEVTVG